MTRWGYRPTNGSRCPQCRVFVPAGQLARHVWVCTAVRPFRKRTVAAWLVSALALVLLFRLLGEGWVDSLVGPGVAFVLWALVVPAAGWLSRRRRR